MITPFQQFQMAAAYHQVTALNRIASQQASAARSESVARAAMLENERATLQTERDRILRSLESEQSALAVTRMRLEMQQRRTAQEEERFRQQTNAVENERREAAERQRKASEIRQFLGETAVDLDRLIEKGASLSSSDQNPDAASARKMLRLQSAKVQAAMNIIGRQRDIFDQAEDHRSFLNCEHRLKTFLKEQSDLGHCPADPLADCLRELNSVANIMDEIQQLVGFQEEFFAPFRDPKPCSLRHETVCKASQDLQDYMNTLDGRCAGFRQRLDTHEWDPDGTLLDMLEEIARSVDRKLYERVRKADLYYFAHCRGDLYQRVMKSLALDVEKLQELWNAYESEAQKIEKADQMLRLGDYRSAEKHVTGSPFLFNDLGLSRIQEQINAFKASLSSISELQQQVMTDLKKHDSDKFFQNLITLTKQEAIRYGLVNSFCVELAKLSASLKPWPETSEYRKEAEAAIAKQMANAIAMRKAISFDVAKDALRSVAIIVGVGIVTFMVCLYLLPPLWHLIRH